MFVCALLVLFCVVTHALLCDSDASDSPALTFDDYFHGF